MQNSMRPLEKAEVKTLPSGLEVAVIRKPGFVRKYAVLATRFGSQVTSMRFSSDGEEYDLPEGTAHFLEHKLFEQEKGNMEERFSELGATSNAFTSNDITGYLFCTNDNFFECLGLLFELVYKPVFSDQGVESERDIIKQEIMMTRDDPDWMGYRTLLTMLYSAHPIAIDPAGTTESIDEITPEVLYAAHDAFYSSDSMTLLIVGDVNPGDVFEVAEILEEKIGAREGQAVEIETVVEPNAVNKTEAKLRMDVARPIVWFGFKDDPTVFAEAPEKRKMAASVLIEAMFGASSKLNDGLYTSGIIDDNLAYDEHYAPDYGYLSLVAATHAAQNGIDPEAYELAKRRLVGMQLKSFDSEEFIAYEFLVDRFHGMDLMDRPSILEAMALDEINRLASHVFGEGRICVLTVEPTETPGGAKD
jgi:predicted Zn-dependent peptidase